MARHAQPEPVNPLRPVPTYRAPGPPTMVQPPVVRLGVVATALGREPAQWVALLSGLVIFCTPLLKLDAAQSGALMAVVTAAGGLWTAYLVSAEKAAAAVAGLVKALVALAAAWRWDWSPDATAGLMVFVEAVVALWLRQQVTAPVTADGSRTT